jgi:hypothetical protein
VVLLSGKDDLMDAAEVKDMLDVAGHVKVSPAAQFEDDTCGWGICIQLPAVASDELEC